MEDERIPDSLITASSYYNPKLSPSNARLNADRAWCAEVNDANQWLQVDFFWTVIVSRIQTQGRQNAHQWVTKFTVSYRQDGNQSFQPYKENGVIKVESINLNG